MTALQIVFLIVAAGTLGAGLMVVSARNLVHAALWLIASLFGVAVFYVLLNAGFLAVAQIVIYIGAIAILVIFAVMMTQQLTVKTPGKQLNSTWWLAAAVAAIVFAGLAWVLSSWEGFSNSLPPLNVDPLTQLGAALVNPDLFVLPFELASILLLAALIGSIVIAWEKPL